MSRRVEERIGRVCRTTFAGLFKSLHFLIVLHLRILIQAVLSSRMPISGAALLATPPAATTTQMARQPRRLHLSILAIHVPAWVEDVPNEDGQEHRRRFQDIEQGLILRQGIAAPEAGGELNEPINDADSNGEHAHVKCPCHPLPTSNLVQGQASTSLGLELVSVELDDQAQEENNEALLHADAAHVQVQAFPL